MSSIAFPHVHYPELGRPLLAAAQRLAVRMSKALHRPASLGRKPGETDAVLRRRLGRDVPAALRRDLGLDPDVL